MIMIMKPSLKQNHTSELTCMVEDTSDFGQGSYDMIKGPAESYAWLG